jgi:hypothetical protein
LVSIRQIIYGYNQEVSYLQPKGGGALFCQECELSTFWAQLKKHNSVDHFNSQAPRNILFLNSYCQLKSRKLSNAGMTDC